MFCFYKCCVVLVLSTSYLGPVSTIVFFIIFTVINKLLMSPVSRYVYLQEKMEGNFRYVLVCYNVYCQDNHMWYNTTMLNEKELQNKKKKCYMYTVFIVDY